MRNIFRTTIKRIRIKIHSSFVRAVKFLIAHFFLPYFYGTPHIYGPKDRLRVGNGVSFANTLLNLRSGTISIGNRVMFGHNVMLLTGYHDVTVKAVETKRPTLTNAERNIVIEDGAWIASGVIVIGPVRIGRNAVIGSGSVVVKNIPSDVFAAGNPALPIKKINFEGS